MPSTATSVIDGLSTSVAVKAPCRAVAIVNITLAGLQTVNGVAVVADDRVLVTAQTDPVDNGIYSASTGQWQRTLDADGNRDLVKGTRVLVESTGDGIGYELVTDNPIVIGTSELEFELREIDSALRAELADGTTAGLGENLVAIQRTEQEIATAVTPTFYKYSSDKSGRINFRRFGALGNGLGNDYQAFQDAIEVAKKRGGNIIIPPPSDTYLIEGALDLTAPVGAVRSGFFITGEGNTNSRVTGYPSALTFAHTGHAFDCTGSIGVQIRDLSIDTDDTTFPKTCFLLARNSDVRSQIVHMRDVTVRGKFSEAIVYNYGSEEDKYYGCVFKNTAGTANAKVWVFTGHNIRSLASTFTTIAAGFQSTIDHQIFGGEFLNLTNAVNGDVFYLDHIASLKVLNPWAACGTETAGVNPRSIFYVDATNGTTSIVEITGITCEHLTALQNYGIRFGGEAVRTHAAWTVRGGTWPNATNITSKHTNASLTSSNIESPDRQSLGGGHDLAGTVSNSIIRDIVNPVSIGVSTNNDLTINSSVLTVTTRDGDDWHDTATRTWTPNIAAGGLVITGALTSGNARFEYHGKQVTATVLFNAATSILGAAGTTISGLPRAVTIGAGIVIVENFTDKTVIGFGHVNGTTIVLPAINETTDQIAVTAIYFVA